MITMAIFVSCSTPDCEREAIRVSCQYHETMTIDLARSDAAIYVLTELLKKSSDFGWREDVKLKIEALKKEAKEWD